MESRGYLGLLEFTSRSLWAPRGEWGTFKKSLKAGAFCADGPGMALFVLAAIAVLSGFVLVFGLARWLWVSELRLARVVAVVLAGSVVLATLVNVGSAGASR